MTLLQLRYLEGISRYGSAAKAADALHVTQSTISLALKDLEREFRLKFFIRTPRGMDLTPEGQVLLRHTRRILEEIEEAQAELHAMGGSYGMIHVAIPPIASSSIWPELSGAVRKRCPGISFKVTAFDPEKEYEKLERGETNVIIRAVYSPSQILSKFSYIRLSKAPARVLCVSENSPLAKRKSIRYQEICDLPLVQLASDSQGRYLYEVFARFGCTPHYVENCDQISNMIEIIQAGVAVGFLNEAMVKKYRGVVGIPIKDEKEAYYYLIWSKAWKERASVTQFVNAVRTLYSQVPPLPQTESRDQKTQLSTGEASIRENGEAGTLSADV